jgi:hypothetical protein
MLLMCMTSNLDLQQLLTTHHRHVLHPHLISNFIHQLRTSSRRISLRLNMHSKRPLASLSLHHTSNRIRDPLRIRVCPYLTYCQHTSSPTPPETETHHLLPTLHTPSIPPRQRPSLTQILPHHPLIRGPHRSRKMRGPLRKYPGHNDTRLNPKLAHFNRRRLRKRVLRRFCSEVA